MPWQATLDSVRERLGIVTVAGIEVTARRDGDLRRHDGALVAMR
jgi:hypothetical protein